MALYQCARLSDSSAESVQSTIGDNEKLQRNCNEGAKERISNEKPIDGENDGTTSDDSIEKELSEAEFGKDMHIRNFHFSSGLTL